MEQIANKLNRFIAKAVDLLIVGFFSEIFYPYGLMAGLLYLLIGDGFFNGQSLGKKLIGLKVVTASDEKKIEFKDSIIRNMFLAVVLAFAFIPLFGMFLMFTAGLFIYGIEIYYIITNPIGERIGDRLAFTKVVDVKQREDNSKVQNVE
ncbi:MAG: RDD family protein [bacterium]